MSSRLKNILIKTSIGFGAFILLALLTFFLSRNYILQTVVAKIQDKFKTRYNSSLIIEEATFNSFSNISIQRISVSAENEDSLVLIKNLDLNFSILKIFKGNFSPSSVAASLIKIQLTKNNSQNNFKRYLSQSNTSPTKSTSKNLADYVKRISALAWDNIPYELKVDSLSQRVVYSNDTVLVCASHFETSAKNINGTFSIYDTKLTQQFSLSGHIDPKNKNCEVLIKPISSDTIVLPIVQDKWNLLAGCNQLQIKINQEQSVFGGIETQIDGSAINVHFQHDKVAPAFVQLDTVKFESKIVAKGNEIYLDSQSVFQINGLKTHVYAFYKKDVDTTIGLSIYSPWQNSQLFFDALPTGMFQNLAGIKSAGELSYRGYFEMDLHNPDSVKLHSSLLRKNFKILSYGKTDLRKMNDTFNLPVYSNDRYLRTIQVGPSNPNFLSYAQIPQAMIYAVLTAEDGSFMWHKGINEDAFRKSIIANIKARRFKRGGSTISMQLVKNIFLHKNKTISRKLEELLIVWLIENLRIASKERMLEIYFNVIEWGPNVYGLNEASHYYFSKPPSELKWNEIIYLTSIIPSPKKFMYEFNEKQELKNLEGYYNIVSRFLVRHGHMTQLEQDSLKANVVLTGPARFELKPIVPDSSEEIDSYNAEEIIQMQLK